MVKTCKYRFRMGIQFSEAVHDEAGFCILHVDLPDDVKGTLSVSDALRVFSIRTLVAAKEIDLNREIINDIVRDHKSKFISTDFIL